jgi:hypothetical protein
MGALLLCCAAGADDDATVRALLQRMQGAQPKVLKKLESFGYREHVLEQRDGKPKRNEVYEVTYFKDRRIRRLVEKDGKPIAGPAIEKENRRVEKLVTQLEKGTAPPLDNKRLRLSDLHRACIFFNARHVMFEGRSVLACEFHPRDGFKPANINERFIHSLDGKLWLDEELLQIAGAECVIRNSVKVGGGLLAIVKPGTHYTDQELLYKGEVWLPKSREFVADGKALLGIKFAIRYSTTYSDYHRFDVSAKDTSISK